MKINNLLLVCTVLSIVWLVSCNRSENKIDEAVSIDKIQKRLDLLEQRVEFMIGEQAAENANRRAESNGFKVKKIE